MGDQQERENHPIVREHPEQRRQEETGHEDAGEVKDVGRPPSQDRTNRNSDRVA